MRVALLCGALILGACQAARADYTVTTCNAAPPAPFQPIGGSPFPYYVDQCSSNTDPGYWLDLGSSAQMPAGTTEGAGVRAPSGTVLTHMVLGFSSATTSNGTSATLGLGYDNAVVFNAPMGYDHQGQPISLGLPDASDVYVTVGCGAGAPCVFSDAAVVKLGALSLTLHDTGVPSVRSLGGSLLHKGVRRGLQNLGFSASDAGSGVQRVTVSLGDTVAGTATSACQSAALRPCPAATQGAVTIDTNAVPDGTSPVTLTAYDASGDPTAVALGSVTIRNHSGTTTVPAHTGARRVHAKVTIGWSWSPKRTVLTAFSARRLPRRATLLFTCRGHGCPLRRRTAARGRLAAFARGLRGKAFHAGERVTVAISAPHLTAQRATLKIVRNAQPVLVRR